VTIDVIAFLIPAAIAVLAAMATVISRNAVHAALFLVINCSAIAVLYLVLNAPFLALAQVAVFVGAIMVLFLFVIMLLDTDRRAHPSGTPGRKGRLDWQSPVAVLLAWVLLAEWSYLLLERMQPQPEFPRALADSSPRGFGEALFGRYLLPFEVTAVILLAAMIGAIVLTLTKTAQRPSGKEKNQ
jgi:NADH-quinone oxidoreductase subunit J